MTYPFVQPAMDAITSVQSGQSTMGASLSKQMPKKGKNSIDKTQIGKPTLLELEGLSVPDPEKCIELGGPLTPNLPPVLPGTYPHPFVVKQVKQQNQLQEVAHHPGAQQQFHEHTPLSAEPPTEDEDKMMEISRATSRSNYSRVRDSLEVTALPRTPFRNSITAPRSANRLGMHAAPHNEYAVNGYGTPQYIFPLEERHDSKLESQQQSPIRSSWSDILSQANNVAQEETLQSIREQRERLLVRLGQLDELEAMHDTEDAQDEAEEKECEAARERARKEAKKQEKKRRVLRVCTFGVAGRETIIA